ncbi:hypothetical protein [Thermogutta sp.]|uniref:hypothetical protein n=1 Tax=Thermogutta sp. TaxID=1962930 RepID=UPI0032201B0F
MMEVGLSEKLLLMIYKVRKHRASPTELAEEIGYDGGKGNVSESIASLLEDGYLREVPCGEGRCYELTGKGLRRIFPFLAYRYVLIFLGILSASLVGMGIVAWVEGLGILPWQMTAIGITSVVLVAFAWFVENKYDELVVRRKRSIAGAFSHSSRR